MKKQSRAGLILFAVFDVLLIAAVVLLLRKTDYTGKTDETASAAPAVSQPAVVPEKIEKDNPDELTMEELEALEEAMNEALGERMSSAESPESLAENPESQEESPVSAAETPEYANLPPTKRCLVDGSFWEGCPERDIQLLTPNPYSRPQYALEEVHDIVIHYVGNPGTTAQENRDYFESLKDGSRSASSHFVIGLDGEIIQCVSCSEWSYASNSRNFDTISIECCHPDASGK